MSQDIELKMSKQTREAKMLPMIEESKGIGIRFNATKETYWKIVRAKHNLIGGVSGTSLLPGNSKLHKAIGKMTEVYPIYQLGFQIMNNNLARLKNAYTLLRGEKYSNQVFAKKLSPDWRELFKLSPKSYTIYIKETILNYINDLLMGEDLIWSDEKVIAMTSEVLKEMYRDASKEYFEATKINFITVDLNEDFGYVKDSLNTSGYIFGMTIAYKAMDMLETKGKEELEEMLEDDNRREIKDESARKRIISNLVNIDLALETITKAVLNEANIKIKILLPILLIKTAMRQENNKLLGPQKIRVESDRIMDSDSEESIQG